MEAARLGRHRVWHAKGQGVLLLAKEEASISVAAVVKQTHEGECGGSALGKDTTEMGALKREEAETPTTKFEVAEMVVPKILAATKRQGAAMMPLEMSGVKTMAQVGERRGRASVPAIAVPSDVTVPVAPDTASVTAVPGAPAVTVPVAPLGGVSEEARRRAVEVVRRGRKVVLPKGSAEEQYCTPEPDHWASWRAC